MADFITRYPGVDAARLGLFGICGGGGYSLAAAQDRQALQVDRDVEHVQLRTGSSQRLSRIRSWRRIQQRLQQASAARAQEVAGGDRSSYAGDAD